MIKKIDSKYNTKALFAEGFCYKKESFMFFRYEAKLPDKAIILDFYKKMGWNDFLRLSAEQLLTAMKQSFYSIYVYDGANLVGTGRVVSDGVINAYICGIGVLPQYRNKGIGTEIAKRLTGHCTSYKLHVQLICEDDLILYYSKMGFEKFAAGMKYKMCGDRAAPE